VINVTKLNFYYVNFMHPLFGPDACYVYAESRDSALARFEEIYGAMHVIRIELVARKSG
jgi:hypothetical protein